MGRRRRLAPARHSIGRAPTGLDPRDMSTRGLRGHAPPGSVLLRPPLSARTGGEILRQLLIGSQACALPGAFPQPFHVAHRRRAAHSRVLAGEVRGVRVAHSVAGARGVEILTEHETAGLLKAHLLLELQGTHRGDRPEVVVESRDAHSELPGDVFDPERSVEVLTEPLHGPCDAVAVAAEDRDLTQPAALLPL